MKSLNTIISPQIECADEYFAVEFLEMSFQTFNRSRGWNDAFYIERFILSVLSTCSLHFYDYKCLRMEKESKYRRVTCFTLNILSV